MREDIKGEIESQGNQESKNDQDSEGMKEKPTSESRATEKHPIEDEASGKAKRKTRKRLALCLKKHKEAMHDIHFNNEMLKEFYEIVRLAEKVKKTIQKLGGFM